MLSLFHQMTYCLTSCGSPVWTRRQYCPTITRVDNSHADTLHTLDSQLSIGMGVNYSHSSLQQIFVLLLLTLDIKTSLNSDIALSGGVDLCEFPWTSLEPTSSSCYLRGEDLYLGNQMSWEEAQRICVGKGGYLIEIGSEEEQALLTGKKGSFFLHMGRGWIIFYGFGLFWVSTPTPTKSLFREIKIHILLFIWGAGVGGRLSSWSIIFFKPHFLCIQ